MEKKKSKIFVGTYLSEKEFSEMVIKKMSIGQSKSFFLREALKAFNPRKKPVR